MVTHYYRIQEAEARLAVRQFRLGFLWKTEDERQMLTKGDTIATKEDIQKHKTEALLEAFFSAGCTNFMQKTFQTAAMSNSFQ